MGALCLLSSCSKSESGDSNPGAPTTLSTISIADAEIIYKRASTSRAGSDDEGYWKIDHQGNESKIVMYDQEGNPTDMEINNIERLTDNLLLIEPASYVRMIADLKTEKLYIAPEILRTPVKEAPDGAIYFIDTWGNNMLYKLDTQSFTIEQALPDGQKCYDFLVNKDGVIYYDHKFKLPNGRIIPDISQRVFLLNGDFFSLDIGQQFKISRWDLLADNDIQQTNILSLLDVAQFERGSHGIERIIQIRQNKSSLIYIPTYLENVSGHEGGILFEFDGTNASLINSYGQDLDQFNMLTSIWIDIETHMVESIADSYICFLPGQILSFNIEDFSISSTPCASLEGYEIYESSVDQINRRLIFTALRYEDGKVVIGEISADGQILIINEKESSNKVISLIPLN